MIFRIGAAILATALIFIYSCAQPFPATAQYTDPLDVASDLVSRVKAANWQYSIGVKKFFNSYTSYQFPNPFPPKQDPLSRLEFPIDQWFFGGDYIYNSSYWSALLDTWVNINQEGRARMQDSDWDQENVPSQKSVFSESKCQLKRSWLVDLKILFNPDVSFFKIVHPVVGARYQTFSFVTHDGYQVGLDGYNTDLPGEGIEFDQTFYQYYLGALINTKVNTSGIFRSLPTTDLTVTLDYALVLAKNQDLHLLREGERITNESTSGHCWHAEATASFLIRQNIKGLIDLDFKRIITNGGHQLTNSFFSVDFSFDGSRVWSDQLSIAASAELIF
ncbi:MAG: omptin family outer membrane protease [Desulfomonilaceae bacterium]